MHVTFEKLGNWQFITNLGLLITIISHKEGKKTAFKSKSHQISTNKIIHGDCFYPKFINQTAEFCNKTKDKHYFFF